VPADYVFTFAQETKVNRALGHSDVKLTWDQTDVARSNKLRNGFSKDLQDPEKEAEYYKDFIAPGSDQDSDERSERDIEEYRQKLLKGTSLAKHDMDNVDWDNLNSDDLDSLEGEFDGKKQSPDIQFTTGFDENIGKKLLDTKREKQESKKMTEFEKYQEKSKEKKRVKKEAWKKKKEQDKKMGRMTEDEVRDVENNRARLKMLVGDAPDSDEEDQIKVTEQDSRFTSVI